MKKIMFALMVVIFVFPQIAGAYMPFNINAFVGGKALDNDDWGKYDDQAEFGVMADFKETSWPVSIVAQAFYSADGKSETRDTNNWDDDDDSYYYGEEAYTSEFNIGVKKIFDLPESWHFYVSGGGARVKGGVEVTEVEYIDDRYYFRDKDTEDDTEYGYWAALGFYKTFWRHFNVGLELRYSDAEIKLFNKDREAGGFHAGLVLGYAWPGN